MLPTGAKITGTSNGINGRSNTDYGFNSVSFVNKQSVKRIVVSGGGEGEERFLYSFIKTSIKCIINWQSDFPSKEIMWIVVN